MLLHGMSNVSNAVASFAAVKAKIESLFGNLEKSLHLGFYFADSESVGRIADITVKLYYTIDGDIVTLVEKQLLARYAVNHHVVYRHAERAGESFETLAERYASIVADELLANLVQKSGRNARLYVASDLRKRSPYKERRTTDKFYLFFCFEQYHLLILIMLELTMRSDP